MKNLLQFYMRKKSNTKMKEDRAMKSSHELNKEEGVKKLN